MLLALLLSIAPTWAVCPEEPLAPAALRGSLENAAVAFAAMDGDSFDAALTAALDGLPCLGSVLAPVEAAAVHRVLAYQSFLDDDRDGALQSMHAAVALQPDYALPGGLAPEGGALDVLYREAGERPASLQVAMDAPRGAVAWVDGSEASTRPANVPAIVQLSMRDGTALWTAYVPPGGHLPEWFRADGEVPGGADGPPPRLDEGGAGGWAGWSAPLRVEETGKLEPLPRVAFGTAGAAALLWVGSAALRGLYATRLGDVQGTRLATNATWTGSVGVGLVATGLITATLVRRRGRLQDQGGAP